MPDAGSPRPDDRPDATAADVPAGQAAAAADAGPASLVDETPVSGGASSAPAAPQEPAPATAATPADDPTPVTAHAAGSPDSLAGSSGSVPITPVVEPPDAQATAAASAAAMPAAALPVTAAPLDPLTPAPAVVPAPSTAVDADHGADGPAHDAETHPEATSASSRIGRIPAAALAALALLAVLGTGYLAWQLWQESRTDTARTEALEAARDAGRLLFSYDHETLEEDFQAGLALTAGEFRDEYERTTREVVTPVATEYDAVVEAEVVEAAIVSAEPDRATALVYVNQTTTSTRVEGPKIDQSRVRMTLRKTDDEWLVERVDAL